MKKLFFSALVAVVAVGGALTSNAQNYFYSVNGGTAIPFTCSGSGISCIQGLPNNADYFLPDTVDPSQPGAPVTDLSVFEDLQRL